MVLYIRICLMLSIISFGTSLYAQTDAKKNALAEVVTFEKHVMPILRQHCLKCHNAEETRGDLDLSSLANILLGSSSGKVVQSGKPDESPLYLLAAHLDSPKMPPNKPKISERELELIRKWIAGGLVEKSASTSVVAKSENGLAAIQPLTRPSAITAIAISPTQPLAALPGQKQILIYDLLAEKLLGGIPFPEGEVHCLKFSRDGQILLAGGGIGGQSGKVVGFQVKSWNRSFTVGDETDAVLACDLSPDQTRVVLGGPTRAVKVYNVADGKLLHSFRKPTDWVTAVGFSPDGLLVSAGDRFGSFFLWETDSGKEYAILRGHTKGITGLSWQADGNAVLTSSEDGTVRLWNPHQVTEEKYWNAHPKGVLDIQFHSSGKIATAGRDGFLRIWDRSGKRLTELGPTVDQALRIAFAPTASAVMSGDWSGEIKLWNLQGGQAKVILRPLKPKSVVSEVSPPKPPDLIVSVPSQQPAKQTTDIVTVPKNVSASEVALQKSKRDVIKKSMEAALAQLRLALVLDPDNAAISRAVNEAEAAIRSLSSEVSP
jgi:WD40 repeat protein